jgi:hypothetical protein
VETGPVKIGITDAVVILGYLVVMVLLGIAFKRFTRDANDFVRSGCRATWWLVGSSSYMAAFSAWTFTRGAVDISQLKIVGSFTFIIGLLLCGVLAVPNTWGIGGRAGILFVTFTIMIVGGLLFTAGMRSERELRETSRDESQNDENSGDAT